MSYMEEAGPDYPGYLHPVYTDLKLLKKQREDPKWREFYDKVADIVVNLLPLDSAIVELGCGPGQFSRILYKRGYRNYRGIDFVPILIDIARNAVPEFKFTLGNLNDKKIQQEFVKYDAFVMLEVLEHLSRDVELLKAIPIGKSVVLSVPFYKGGSHLRSFRKAGQVRSRYGMVIDFNEVITIGPRKKHWMGYGVKK